MVRHRYDEPTILNIILDAGRCGRCKHVKEDGATCKAFPKGIPEEILRGKHKHERKYEGDGGYRFEPIKE